jgi:nucleoside-diphosphate-sugar epimerase
VAGLEAKASHPDLICSPVLITGANGFIGGHLARRLVEAGAEVHVIVRSGSDQRLTPSGTVLHEHSGDTADLVRLTERIRPCLTFHLATRFVSRHQPGDVLPLVADNVGFAVQLFEALSRSETRRIVSASSAWQRAGDGSYNPPALYAATKQAADDILRYYTDSGELRAITLILHDTYGVMDRREKIIPLLERAALAGATVELSPGEQRIDLVHVADVVDAFILAGRRLLEQSEPAREEFVVSSDSRHSLREIAELHSSLSQQLRGVAPRLLWGARAYRRNEIMEPWSGGARLPGWEPRVSLSDGLRELITAATVR